MKKFRIYRQYQSPEIIEGNNFIDACSRAGIHDSGDVNNVTNFVEDYYEVFDKPFTDLTIGEATHVAEEIVKHSTSENEIRRRLSDAGFDGDAADVVFVSDGLNHNASAHMYGPQQEIITV